MGKTIIEKIIANHTTEDVAPGNIVWMEIDVRTARDFGGANVVKNLEKYYPNESQIADPRKTYFTFDCVVPAKTIGYAENQHIARVFARENLPREHLYDVDAGVGSHIMIEEGIAVPGNTVVGTDSHLNILGAIGSFGQGMGDQDIAFTFKTGRTWFEVPESMNITIEGNPKPNAFAKDVTLGVLQQIGSKGALGKAIEFYGNTVESLDLAERITLASMVTEMGGIIGLIPPNDQVIKYCKERSGNNFPVYKSDVDVEYTETLNFDFSNLEPLIALPPSPANVKPVAEVAGIPVDSVVIASCTNGRYEDISLVARILKNKKINPNVMLKIVPATKEVYGQLLKNGLITVLYEAGAIITNPGCGGCAAGQIGMTGKGEVQVSTGNRNFAGKQGGGDTYLASPATAAATALAGEISVPEI
ncbi:MAG: 3-isopropylmalate dehydratase large subunit [Candidatus Heimdallarchaeota archaeon]|nr:MAG: 3-isopropylmalate dehydratase large subunit [Candidatus Heimdallarchaeota archaeon]